MERLTTGNIFEDLGFSSAEAGLLKGKSLLMLELETIVKHDKLTPAQQAKRFGVNATVVQALKGNNLDFFSIDVLIKMLNHAGKEVLLSIKDKKHVRGA